MELLIMELSPASCYFIHEGTLIPNPYKDKCMNPLTAKHSYSKRTIFCELLLKPLRNILLLHILYHYQSLLHFHVNGVRLCQLRLP
jgi:hypothetical protein